MDLHKTYRWAKLSREFRESEHNECQRCKHCGKYASLSGIKKYSKAVLVHHDFRADKYPQYFFMPVVNGVRNFYSLCQSCHEIEHEGERGLVKETEDFNEEKW